MPPKVKFSQNDIIDAALALTRSHGIGEVTARKVAQNLGASTAPIFSNFEKMDDLHEALMDRIIATFLSYAVTTDADDPILATGAGWLRFAKEEPQLYEAVFLRPHPWHDKWGPIRKQLAVHLADDDRYGHLKPKERFALIGRASIVLHGLGLEIWSGRMPAHSPETLFTQLVYPVLDTAVENGWTDDLHSSPKQKRKS